MEELDLTNEVRLDLSTVQARLIYDNKYNKEVLLDVRAIMSANGFDPLRVTASTTASEAGRPTQGTGDCLSIYNDSARVFGMSALLAGIGGGLIGLPVVHTLKEEPNYVDGLVCASTNNNIGNMVSTGHAYYEPPNILDIHATPLEYANPRPDPNQYTETSKWHAIKMFNGIRALIDSFCPGGWREYYVPSLCHALFMLGETAAFKPNPTDPGSNCDGSPFNTPFSTAQGFNESSLAGRADVAVFRPWLDGWRPCWELPHPVNQVLIPSQ